MVDYLDSVTLADVVQGTLAPAVDAKFADRASFADYVSCAEKCRCFA